MSASSSVRPNYLEAIYSQNTKMVDFSPVQFMKSVLQFIKYYMVSMRAAPLPSVRQMSGQRSPGSVGAYQADERAGVARLCWRVSGR